jgi:hypothetical protein
MRAVPWPAAGWRLGWTVRLLLCCPAKRCLLQLPLVIRLLPALSSLGTANFVTKKNIKL